MKYGLKNTWKVFWKAEKTKNQILFFIEFFLLNFVKFHNNILNSFANNIFICNQCYCYLYYNWTINIIYDQDTKRNGCYLNGIVCCEYLKEMFAVKSLEILNEMKQLLFYCDDISTLVCISSPDFFIFI